jgi:hypothetical protein
MQVYSAIAIHCPPTAYNVPHCITLRQEQLVVSVARKILFFLTDETVLWRITIASNQSQAFFLGFDRSSSGPFDLQRPLPGLLGT